jgi:hypothetical protein
MVVVDEDGEKQLFLRKIASLPSSHFAAVPFDISKEIPTKVSRKVNLPSLIPLYSKSQVLIEHMGTKSILTASEFAERELLLGYLYTDTLQLLTKCNENTEQYRHTPSYTFWLYILLKQGDICTEAAKLLEEVVEPCLLIKRYPIDYLVRSPESPPSLSKFITNYTTSIWISPKRQYEIRSLKRTEALEALCHN